MTALLLLRNNWRAILVGGGLILLVLTIAVQTTMIARRDATIATRTAERDAATLKLQVSNGSISRLETALADKNRESEERAKAYATVKAATAADLANADKAKAADRGRIEALEAIRKAAMAHPGCPVPPALTAQLEGL